MSFIRGSRSTRLPSGRVLQLTAILALISLVIGLAINADGFDVKRVNLNNHNIWILQKVDPKKKNQDDGRYARVNTQINELGLKNIVKKPTDLLQTSTGSLLFNKEPSYINISSADPIDFTPDSDGAISLPTAAIASDISSTVTALVDSSRTLRVSIYDGNIFPAPIEVKPPKGVTSGFGFDSVALTTSGIVFAFSATDGSVRQYDPVQAKWLDAKDQVNGATSGSYQMAMVGSHWAVLNPDTGKLWVQGSADATDVGKASYLQKSGANDNIYLSTLTELSVFDVNSRQVATVQSVVGAQETSRPIEFNKSVFAAWLSADKGWFYDTAKAGQLQELAYNEKTLDSQQLLKPTTDLNLVTNGESAIINETYSGWAWSLPTGELISGSQNWDGDPPPVKNCDTDCPPPDQMPPRPVDDTFGVRAGQLVSLPVLINDSDTNLGDIITIDPESVKGLDPNFGEVRTSANQQMLVVAVKPGAKGSASFKYQISDGVSGKPSRSATVHLNVKPNGTNNPPGWCTDVVPTCIQQWPEVRVEPGSEVSIPFLDAWVDPEGDRFFISSATITDGEGNLAFGSDGQLVYQDVADGKKSSTVTAKIVVSDVRGASVTKALQITVAPKAGASLNVPVIIASTTEPTIVDFSKYVSGSSNPFAISVLVANEANRNTDLSIEPLDDTKAKLTSTKAGPAILDLGLKDADGYKLNTSVRVNFVDPAAAELSTSPVTVLVSPNLDTSVDLFGAAHNPANRALVISALNPNPVNGGTIWADKIKGGFLRVRGKTQNNTAGFVGTVNYKISDGSGDSKYTATGQLFVYEMPDPENKPPVSRADSVVVRAGDTASVDVLANDLGYPGVPLVIDSKSFKRDGKESCIQGGLIFSGGGKVRIVAPQQPGLYECHYSIYPVNNPANTTPAQISIRVQPNNTANSAPQPVNIFARVRAGETVNIPIPVHDVDPDGDQVTVRAISGIRGDKGAAYINPDGTSLEYSAQSEAKGQDTFSYTLVDSHGLVSETALVKVAILNAEPDTAPVTMNDYAEVVLGDSNKVVLDPVSNDFDPQPDAKNPISLVKGSVKPSIPSNNKYYDVWKKLILKVNGNKVTIAAGKVEGIMTFTYRAKSSSGSESEGQITVKVTKTTINDAPDVTDTFVTLAQQRDLLTTTGIDVVSDKILWSSGDVNKLTLSVWGGLDGFKVLSNSSLTSAVIPENPGIVIFKVSGTNFYGKEVESYGFMHLPGLTPKITFDPSTSMVRVNESQSKTFDIAQDVNLPGQITVGKVTAHGLRKNASCKVSAGTVIQYSAGSGAPWTDFCDVQIKVTGSTEPFTTIMVPVKVIPTNPEPILLGRQLTILPGDENAQVTELKTMTTWEGKTEADKDSLQYNVEGGKDLFDISRQGTQLTIKVFPGAKAGESRRVKISISNHPNTTPVYLVLIVGQLPNNLPIGATLTLECGVNDQISSCQTTSADLNNGPGVYNPFDGEALRYAPFGYTNGPVNWASGSDVVCGDVKLRTTADSITAKWSQVEGKKAAGSKCSIVYHVLDKMGRIGTGVLEFTFRGVPAAVRSVTQIAYTATTITLQIVPPTSSSPAITGFEVSQDGAPSFNCPIDENSAITQCVIRNLQPYDGVNKKNLHKYSVRASNSEGVSNVARTLEDAYAFRAPKALTDGNIRAKTIYDPAATTTVGWAEVTITPVSDPSVKSYSVSSDVVGSQVDVVFTDFATPKKVKVAAKPGERSVIRVAAVGDVKPPIGTIADAGSSATWQGRISAVPKVGEVTTVPKKSGTGWTTRIAVASANRNWAYNPTNASFILYTGFTKPRCDWDPNSNRINVVNVNGGTSQVTTGTYSDWQLQTEDILSPQMTIEDNASYTPMVCYANGFGIASAVGKSTSTLSDPADGVFQYAVNPDPVAGAWLVALTASGNSSGVYAQFNGSKTDPTDWRNNIYSTAFGEDPEIHVRYCKVGTSVCSTGNRLVTPSDATRSWQLAITKIEGLVDVATGADTTACVRLKDIDFKLKGSGLTSSSGTQLWQAGEGSTWSSATTSGTFDKPGDYLRLPRNAVGVTKIQVKFQGRDSNASPHVSGLTGAVILEFACH
ncbi:MAG: hypothetical protein RLZZ06_330 [Actinomycetota bacterium]